MKDGTGSGTSADSFVGSLISLTSKSEIRYEGILHSVDAENANISLQNVCMFGTEGRKMDGPQIPASNKVYDYIIFRGSDIKDLQVKSSPATQTVGPQPHNDPAIISLQSHHSQAASIPPGYVPPPAVPSMELRSPYNGFQAPAFRNSIPLLYQPPAGMGTWGIAPAAVNGNGTGIDLPSMYWQGYYRSPGAHSQLQQQPLPPQIPPNLPPVTSAQEQKQPTAESPFSVGLFSPASADASQISTLGSTRMLSPVLTSLPAGPEKVSSTPFTLSFDASSSSIVSGSAASSAADISSLAVHRGGSGVIGRQVDCTQQQPQIRQPGCASTAMDGTRQVITANGQMGVGPSPENFMHQPKVELKACESTSTMTMGDFNGRKFQQSQKVSKPLLPFPSTTSQQRQFDQVNGSVGNSNFRGRGRGQGQGRGRGRGRGRGGRGQIIEQSRQQFSEDFDFAAMNEKFKKEEVWGELGKVDKDADSEDLADGTAEDSESELFSSKTSVDLPGKPTYVKDDFFDTLSCDALDREGGRVDHMKFSEQRKVDTETFGSFPFRSRGRGGRRRGGYGSGYPVDYYVRRGR